MPLTEKQNGVRKGVILGGLIALCIVGFSSYLNPFSYEEPFSLTSKLHLFASSALIPALFLAISIGRMARQRFLTPQDLDGAVLTSASEQARILQSLLQNTLEQTLLAVLVYFAWCVSMPATHLSAVPIAAVAFGLGRILFFAGYKKGAVSRAIGFTLSFYPSIIMLSVLILASVWRLVT